MNGSYSHTLRIASWTIEIDENKEGNVIAKKKIELKSSNQYHIYVHSTKNISGLCRSIFIMRGEGGHVINDQCLLQYTIQDKNCDKVSFNVPAHGNSKKSSKPFYPVKKSTIEALKKEVTTKSPSVVYSNASAAAGGIMGAREPGDLPRSRQQMYDLKYKSKKTDEVDELLQYSKHKEESIILEHHDVPEDLWVLGKKHMTSDLSRFCTSEKLCHPFSVDPTFSFGKYEVTPFTYKHLFLKCKRTGAAPTFLGPTAIQYTKGKSIYKKIVSAVCNSAPTLAEKGKGFITDGEDALHSAIGEVLTHATGLRCFRHFQQNCQDQLRKLGIQQKQHQKVFLDTVFGKQGVCHGILDANTKDELQEKLTASRELLETEETRITGRKFPQFWKYVNSHKEMIEKCMIGDARKRAGMPCDQFGTPLRSYTNQSESINNKLTRQKEAIVKNDKNKVDLSKLQFTKDVWEEVDKHQQEELQMAICGIRARRCSRPRSCSSGRVV